MDVLMNKYYLQLTTQEYKTRVKFSQENIINSTSTCNIAEDKFYITL